MWSSVHKLREWEDKDEHNDDDCNDQDQQPRGDTSAIGCHLNSSF